MVDSELHEEEEAASELSSLASVAGTLSCERALADGEATAVQIPGININGVWRKWPTTASREVVVRAE
jgi:hypothetical protein